MIAVVRMGPADVDGSGLRIDFSRPSPTNLRPVSLVLRRQDIPGNVRNGTLAEVEAWIDQWLADQLSWVIVLPGDPDDGVRVWEMHARSHVRSSNPLLVDVELSRDAFSP